MSDRHLQEYDPDQPIPLQMAVDSLFPPGAVSLSALRKEIRCGRLVAWRVGGKHLTSKVEIERMLERCRVSKSLPDSGIGPPDQPKMAEAARLAPGSFSTTDVKLAQAAARTTLEALKKR